MKKMKEVLYYTPGKLEWHLRIPASRKNYLQISFTGGSFTSRGLVCGSFKTDNQVIQSLIEESREFKAGQIRKRSRTNTEMFKEYGTFTERSDFEGPDKAQ